MLEGYDGYLTSSSYRHTHAYIHIHIYVPLFINSKNKYGNKEKIDLKKHINRQDFKVVFR